MKKRAQLLQRSAGSLTTMTPKRKESFDAEGKVADILSRFEKFRGLKGKFINLCIEIAEEAAWDRLTAELNEVRKGGTPPLEKNKKENKKP